MDILLDEVESLEAILMDDVRITRNGETGLPEIIETTVFPIVDNTLEEQYVCVNLQVIPTEGYPDNSPEFNLLKPRGLDDQRLETIRTACIEKLKESQGYPVVFDLIEIVREHLSGSNLPSGQCVVCLYGFQDGDDFIKTECFHYLHSYCLERHLRACRDNYREEQDKLPAWLRKASEPFQATCPVCRDPIKDELEKLKGSIPPKDFTNAPEFVLTDELKNVQRKMACLFLQQKQRGGIIDVEADISPIIVIEPHNCSAVDANKPDVSDGTEILDVGKSTLDQKKKHRCSAEPSVDNHNASSEKRRITGCSLDDNSENSINQTVNTDLGPNTDNYHIHNRRHGRGRRHHYHHRSDNYCSSQQSSVVLPERTPTQPNTSKQKKGIPSGSTNFR